MALSESLPYGLRDVKIYPIVNGVVGAGVDLPNSQTFSFEEAEEFDELRGDDKVRAKRGKGPSVNWTLESGGISLPAYAILNGGTATLSGTAPNQKYTYSKKGSDQRPEFQVEGRSISESGGDFHAVVYRCKTDGKISGELSDGSFWISKCDGTAMPRTSDDALYDFVQNETAAEISVSTNPVPVISSIAPAGRSVGGQITIYGSFFTGTTAVSIDSVTLAAAAWSVVNDGIIVAIIPAGAVTASPVIVTNAAGASTSVSYTVV